MNYGLEGKVALVVGGATGIGFAAASLMGRDDLSLMKGLKLLGQTEVKEEIYALCTRRSQHHPLVQQVLQAAQD